MIDYEGSWDRHIPLVKFVYNNSFQSSIGMTPYEALYGRKCRTLLCWTELGERKVIGPDLIQETEEKVKMIRFIGPYEVIEKVGPVAYRLALPPELEKIHNVFHVSMLRRYRSDPSHVVSSEIIELRPNLTYEKEPVEILAREVKELRIKKIPLVKVLWRNHKTKEATWESEEMMR